MSCRLSSITVLRMHHLLPKLKEFGLSGPSDLFARYLDEACRASGYAPSQIPEYRRWAIAILRWNWPAASTPKVSNSSSIAWIWNRGHAWNVACAQAAGAADTLLASQFYRLRYQTPGNRLTFTMPSSPISFYTTWLTLKACSPKSSNSRPGGKFLISDMIGRNGHQRWPEALTIVHDFWRKLPPSYRFNRLVGYYEGNSIESFGIAPSRVLRASVRRTFCLSSLNSFTSIYFCPYEST